MKKFNLYLTGSDSRPVESDLLEKDLTANELQEKIMTILAKNNKNELEIMEIEDMTYIKINEDESLIYQVVATATEKAIMRHYVDMIGRK